jgi:uracil-DNA glycosylase family 4
LTTGHEHYCDDPEGFPTGKFLQPGTGVGARILMVGESLAPDGWRKSNRAFYKVNGEITQSGKNLNKLLSDFGLSVDGSGDTERCGFTDLVKCYVGDSKRLKHECGHRCWPIFERQLRSYDFKLLMILGVDTLMMFNREAGTKLRSHELTTVEVFGSEYRVLPIYHPSRPYLNNKNLATLNKLCTELEALLTQMASP